MNDFEPLEELSPEALGLLDETRSADDPTPRDRARVKRGLMAAIASGAGVAASSAAATSTAAASTTAATTTAATTAAAPTTAATTTAATGLSFGVKLAAVIAVVGAVGGTVAVAPWEGPEPARTGAMASTAGPGVEDDTGPRTAAASGGDGAATELPADDSVENRDVAVVGSTTDDQAPAVRTPGAEPPFDGTASGRGAREAPRNAVIGSSPPAVPTPSPGGNGERSAVGPSPSRGVAGGRATADVGRAASARPRGRARRTAGETSLTHAPETATRATASSAAPETDRDEARSDTDDAEPPSPSTLAAEVALLHRAQRAINRDDAETALRHLAEHARRFPAGIMTEEREAARVVALCAAGRREEARAVAARFLRERPASPLTPRVRAACD